jgi:hypothetical protein
MEETVGPVSTCGRGLLRGWWQPIGLMASFMIFTASVRKILDKPSYCYQIILRRSSLHSLLQFPYKLPSRLHIRLRNVMFNISPWFI